MAEERINLTNPRGKSKEMKNKLKKGWFRRKENHQAIVKVVAIHESGDYLCTRGEKDETPYRSHHYEFEKEFEEVTEEWVNSVREPQNCPRRMSGEDWWTKDEHGIRKCSFCGSTHPEDVLSNLEEGKLIVEPSTKSYKWYLKIDGRTYKYYRQHDSQCNFVERYNAIIKKLEQ